MGEINIRVSQMEGRVPVSVLHVSGDIDAGNHQQLDDKAAEIIDAGAHHIILDLTETSYMSSAGFRSMHKIHVALQATDSESASLKLLKPSDEIRRLMKTIGFDVYISTYDDLTEAVNSF
ncbi:MAG: STAS domain-containing protein [Gammaproteobacteria bacterium]|nr:STAS domain-containing protein [Gammaproteobacteria bacterium]